MRNAIFMDIDGTIAVTLEGKEYVPQSTVDAIRKTREKGNLVFLCTGRSYCDAMSVWYIGFDGIIGASGSYVEVNKEVKAHHTFDPDDVVRFMDYFSSHEITYYLECNEGMFGSDDFRQLLMEEFYCGDESAEALKLVFPAKAADLNSVNKITFLSKTVPFKEIEKEFQSRFSVIPASWTVRNHEIGEISLPGISKAAGIQIILKSIPDLHKTYSFGDSMNDLEMFRNTDISICMGDSMNGVEKYASYIAGKVLDDGIMHAMKHFGLI